MKHILNILLVIIFSTLCLSGICRGATKVSTPVWKSLMKYEGKPFKQLDPEAQTEFKDAASIITTDMTKIGTIKPELFAKLKDSQGKDIYTLIRVDSPMNSHAETHIQAFYFNKKGEMFNSSEFNCGWKIDVGTVLRTYIPEIKRNGIMIESYIFFMRNKPSYQYYAMVGNQLLLVRNEDAKGKLLRGRHGAPNLTPGFIIKGRSPEEWEKSLQSKDNAEVLATLMWLSGTHLNPNKPVPDWYHEDLSEAQLVDTVRSRAGVKATLEILTQSKNPWIREAAVMATKVEYYPHQ